MTILGRGDLSPPRHHRRRTPALVAVAVVLALAVLGAGGYFGWRAWRGTGKAAAAPPRTCVTPTPAATPAPVAAFALAVLNSTPRQGMAHQVAAALHARGFRIGHVGNTTPAVAGSAVVSYAADLAGAARTVAEQVPGATLAERSTPGITLVLGPAFRSLTPVASVAPLRAADFRSASPRPPVCSAP